MGSVITLTTDFGVTDAYAAVMKGVVLRINPEADIVDISHFIPPQDIYQAALILSASFDYFPTQTVHLAVVDPGMGTNRRPIILKTLRAYFVAPDNGVLSHILEIYSSRAIPDSQRVQVGKDLKG
jgi:S-adenosylmethionine hydrolase